MIIFSFATDIGKIREKNEDAFGHYKDEFFIVADGLGGLPAGEVAAQLAVEKAVEVYQKLKDPRLAFEAANKAVFEKAQREPKFYGMATTLVGVAVGKDKAVFANVGDSRGYLIRGGLIRQITEDHKDFTGAISRVVGFLTAVEIDTFKVNLKKDDLLLLCTDGLTDMLTDEQILEILKNPGDAEKTLNMKTKELIEAANDAGGIDNITVCLIGA
jgi:protein phosphatase